MGCATVCLSVHIYMFLSDVTVFVAFVPLIYLCGENVSMNIFYL